MLGKVDHAPWDICLAPGGKSHQLYPPTFLRCFYSTSLKTALCVPCSSTCLPGTLSTALNSLPVRIGRGFTPFRSVILASGLMASLARTPRNEKGGRFASRAAEFIRFLPGRETRTSLQRTTW